MNKLTLTLASVASLALVACNDTADDAATTDDTATMTDEATPTAATEGTIVEVAQGNADFSMLVSAITSADLAETLSGTGPFTVFAPTNAAFEKVPQATRDELMSAAGKDQLKSILTYHVVPGDVMAAALSGDIEAAGEGGYEMTTVNGAKLTAMMEGGNVVLRDEAGNTATVTMTDVDASNGVIHAIDTVLMPS